MVSLAPKLSGPPEGAEFFEAALTATGRGKLQSRVGLNGQASQGFHYRCALMALRADRTGVSIACGPDRDLRWRECQSRLRYR